MEIVFLGINSEGKLDCLVFENKMLREQKSFAVHEKEKIWSGMLIDGRLFAVTIERIPFYLAESGKIANVDLKIKYEEKHVHGFSQSIG